MLIINKYIYIHTKLMSTDKKDTRNQLTRDAGLVFNVNTMKTNMKEFFKNQDLYFSVKNDSGDVTKKLPMFKGSQVAITAVFEQLTRMVFNNVLQYTNTDKSGLRTVTRPILKYSVCLHRGLNEYYNYRMNSFNKNQVYKEQLPFKEDEIAQIMTSVNKKLMFTPKSFNLLCFLLLEAYLDIMSTAYDFIVFANKRTLGPTAISAAVRNRFPDVVSHELCNELSRACAAVGKDIDGGEEDGEQEANDEEEEEAPPPKKSAKNSKTAAKPATKSTKGKSVKAAQIEEDDEDEEEDEGEGDDSDEDEEEEEVIVAKPKKKVVAASSSKKTRKAKH